jgi:hypothetical protein
MVPPHAHDRSPRRESSIHRSKTSWPKCCALFTPFSSCEARPPLFDWFYEKNVFLFWAGWKNHFALFRAARDSWSPSAAARPAAGASEYAASLSLPVLRTRIRLRPEPGRDRALPRRARRPPRRRAALSLSLRLPPQCRSQC